MDDRLPPDERFAASTESPARLLTDVAGSGDVDARLRALVVDAERALLSPEVRRDRAALERLLDDRFTEIGQSGRLWTRDEMIAALVSEGQPPSACSGEAAVAGAAREMSELRATALGPDTVLLTYLLHFDERWSRRSSVWVVQAGAAGDVTARIVFHQGTSVHAA